MMKIICYGVVQGDIDCFHEAEKSRGVELILVAEPLSEKNIQDAKGCDAVSVTVSSVVTAERMKIFADMGIKFVTARSVGYNYIDLEAAKAHGIRVSNTLYSEHCVADFTLMLMLMTVRKAGYMLQKAQSYDYTVHGMRGRDMPNLTVGVIGTGRIGNAVIDRVHGFGSKILAFDLYPKESLKGIVDYVPLEELIQKSDIITFHAPATKENEHLFNAKSLEMAKDGVILINTSRGELINTEVMLEGLATGKIAAAGLDTFEDELGLIRTNVGEGIRHYKNLMLLQALPNVILTPHVAYYTDQTREDLVYNNIDNLLNMAKNESIPCEVKA
ncbi:MAG: NAD(P)-dependent oxidoreductase [Eubacteriales bacterium]